MAMPMARFLAYTRQIPAVRAEETLAAIEAASISHAEKRSRKRAVKQLLRTASGIAPEGKKKRMAGGLPADVASLMMLERQSPILRGLVEIVKKPTAQEDES